MNPLTQGTCKLCGNWYLMIEDSSPFLHPFYYWLQDNLLGNSPHSNSIFKLQKKIIRIIMDVGIRDSCREFFKTLNILPLISQYIFSLLLFVLIIKNNLGWILGNKVSEPGILLISINLFRIWLFIKKVPFVWLLRYITALHLK